MLLKNLILFEAYLISSFISGDKDEIKPMLRLLKPYFLTEAFETVAFHEQSVGQQEGKGSAQRYPRYS